MNTVLKDLIMVAGEFAAEATKEHPLAFDGVFIGKYTELVLEECQRICREHGNSAEYSYTPARALLVKKSAYGCAQLIGNLWK